MSAIRIEEGQFVVPTLREELDRKVFETLDWLINAESRGRLTKEQVSAGLDALFMAVSGLVDNDFMTIITAAQEQSAGPQSAVKRLFHHPSADEIVTITWRPTETRVTTAKRLDGLAVGGTVKDFDTPALAARFVRDIGAGFDKKGWIEL